MGCDPLACVCGKFVLPQRYLLCFMTLMGIINSYAVRVCLNIALTEMVVSIPKNDSGHEGHTVCEGEDEKGTKEGGTYNWTQHQQATVLGAFFPGYVITHIPGGFMADVFGGKHVFAGGILISAIMTALTPVCAEYGGYFAVASTRFVVGACQGALFPASTTLLAKWVPKKERGRLGSLVLMGPQFGSLIGNLLSAYLISMYKNWHLVFYFWGVMCLVCYAVFIILCHSEPSRHPFITPEEKQMLDEEIGVTKKFKIPWLKIFFDKPCIALALGQIGHAVIFFFIVTELPKYFKDVLKFNIKQNGILNALPYAALLISGGISGVFADKLINSGKCSVLFIRQLFTTISSVGPSIFVLVAGYLGCDRYAAASMFTLALFFMGPFYPGLRVNAMDITKNFAGLLTAYVNGMGALSFAPFPNIIAVVTPDHSLEQWRYIFWLIFIIASITNVIYVIWASGDRAQWDLEAEAKE